MWGPGLQFSRSRNSDDRFCSASRAHRDYLGKAQSDCSSNRSWSQSDKPPAENSKPAATPVLESSHLCNLEMFLESVTPSVPGQSLSKMAGRSWRTSDAEFQPFFFLSDLWESFKEWSAYGAGVPLVLNDSDCVVQYYVPYLSGIQLYGDLSKSTEKSRRPGEESDGEYFRDSSSDGSSDSEQDRGYPSCPKEPHNCDFQIHDIPPNVELLSLRAQHMAFPEGFSSDEGQSGSSQGCLLFEYLERDPPYCREPLTNKILDLARRFPELKTLGSCDLLSSSWISVAWYPIYRIPTGQTLEDLDACFLTFHSLHTLLTGSETVKPPTVTYPTETDGVPQILLPVFGLASYRYRSSLWTPDAGDQRQLANSLLQDADNWLNWLKVKHPDFAFFCRRSILEIAFLSCLLLLKRRISTQFYGEGMRTMRKGKCIWFLPSMSKSESSSAKMGNNTS